VLGSGDSDEFAIAHYNGSLQQGGSTCSGYW
jgi:hypothetical protein